MKRKSALVAGASGLVGGELLKHLLADSTYDQVVVLGRRPLGIKHPKLSETIVDFDNLHQYKEQFKVDHVYSCIGTTIKKAKTKAVMEKIDLEYPLNIAKLAKEMGCDNFLLISSMGADPNSKIWYPRLKGLLEEKLKEVGFKALHILRPSLLLGNRKEFRFGEYVGAIFAKTFSFAFVGPLTKYRAIKASTVASCMIKVAQEEKEGTFIYLSDKIEAIGTK